MFKMVIKDLGPDVVTKDVYVHAKTSTTAMSQARIEVKDILQYDDFEIKLLGLCVYVVTHYGVLVGSFILIRTN